MTTSLSGGSGFRGPAGTGRNIIPKGYSQGQLGQFTPEQQQLFQHLFSNVGPESFTSKLAGGDQSQFEQMEAPALRQFGQLQQNIANRFSGRGSGARRSSAFQNEMSGATSDFAQKLQANRLGLQQNALQQLMEMSNMLLGQRPYENFLIEKQKKQSGLAKAFGIGLPALGAIGGGIFGGPAGAALGGQLGGSLASGFSGSPSQSNYSGIGSLPTKWGS